ncbi:MAG TPA: adenylate kinase [Coleofasciculaceae cyanobacterium]
MTRLIFLGAPGAGKGTQAQTLAQEQSIPHISTGDILRNAVANQTELGLKAKSYMDAGELVPDQLMLDLVRDRLSAEDIKTGWILDGFPRTVGQAEFLDTLLSEIQQSCSHVVNFDVPDEVLVSRLLGRGRVDDTEAVIRNRLQVYREQTAPLIDFYSDRGHLVSIDGSQEIDAIASTLRQTLELQS